MGLFEKKTIAKVTFLGTRTGSETKILATYNFTVYSFFIQYTDGSTERVEICPENSFNRRAEEKRLQELLTKANEAPPKNDSSAATSQGNNQARTSSDVYSDLKSIKELFDSGVITEEMYNEQREVLIAELSREKSATDVSTQTQQSNLIVSRMSRRPVGEAKTIVVIDGVQRKEFDIDNGFSTNLSSGEHTILFKRAALKSNPIHITVTAGRKYKVVVNPKVLSIEASLTQS